MVTLILGKKGSGKTKRLIDMCNAAMAASKGNVVFIEKDSTLTYDLSHKARLAVADSYDIQGFDSFYGFIAGMCAGNYDITDVFVDSTLKIGGRDMEALVELRQEAAGSVRESRTPTWCSPSRRIRARSPPSWRSWPCKNGNRKP